MNTESLKPEDLREKNVQELGSLLIEQRRAQFNLRMQPVTGTMPNPHEFKVLKKNIAKINTVIREKA